MGGLYGVALGRVFFGESMFSRADDASKVALVHLCRAPRRLGLRAHRLPDAHRPPDRAWARSEIPRGASSPCSIASARCPGPTGTWDDGRSPVPAGPSAALARDARGRTRTSPP